MIFYTGVKVISHSLKAVFIVYMHDDEGFFVYMEWNGEAAMKKPTKPTIPSKVKEEDLNDLPFAFYVRLYQVFFIISRAAEEKQQLTTTSSRRNHYYEVGTEI